MPQFRRRDTGALVEARQVKDDEKTTTPFYRISPVAGPTGAAVRVQNGEHEVSVEKGQWLVREGEHAYPYPDEYFKDTFVDANDHEFVPHVDLGPRFHEVASREADESVKDGKRYSELHGDAQDPDRVQMHAAFVAHMAGDDERADRILKQHGLPKDFPDNLADLLTRRGDFVDAATIAFLEQQEELARLRRQVSGMKGSN